MVRPLRRAHVDQEHREPAGALRHLLARRGAREQQHQVGMLGARGPDLLAVDDVVVAVAHRRGAQAERVGAGGRLGDAERLQPQFALGDRGQLALLLRGAAVPQQRAHGVHLRVAGGAVAAGRVDLLHDRRGGRTAAARCRRIARGSARRGSRPWSARRRIRSDSRARGRARASIRPGNPRTARAPIRGSARGRRGGCRCLPCARTIARFRRGRC